MKKRLKLLKNKTHLLLAITIATFVGGIGSAIVMAAIPDSQGVIHACYIPNVKGKVSIIDSSTQTCPTNETELTWNQKGVKGDTGSAGVPGAGSSNVVGHVLTLNWGDIPAGGTPQELFTVPGFGDVKITKCSNSGDVDVSFTNTSGQPINYINDGPNTNTIAPGETVSNNPYGALPLGLGWIGNGQTSKIATVEVGTYISVDNHTCLFQGISRLTT